MKRYIYTARNILTGEIKTFNGSNELKAAGFDPANVSATCMGRHLHHKGWVWTRIEKE